jgi:hypothetical protein
MNDNNSKDKALNENISELNERVARSNSFFFSFLRGIFTGVGTAIGATIVAGILIALLGNILNSAEDIPILDTLIRESQIQEQLDEDN